MTQLCLRAALSRFAGLCTGHTPFHSRRIRSRRFQWQISLYSYTCKNEYYRCARRIALQAFPTTCGMWLHAYLWIISVSLIIELDWAPISSPRDHVAILAVDYILYQQTLSWTSSFPLPDPMAVNAVFSSVATNPGPMETSMPSLPDSLSKFVKSMSPGPKPVITVISENHPYVLAILFATSLLSIIMFFAKSWSVCFTTLRPPVYWQFGTLDRTCPSENSKR